MWSKILLCSLQGYFILMSLTVERSYCHNPLTADDPGFLMKDAYEFSVENNRLFLERPEWMRVATCIHCYTFPLYYAMVFVATLVDAWHIRLFQCLFLVFVGAKVYAIGFYHFMEFTSHVPPEHLLPYFAAEGPYLVSIGMVLWNLWHAVTIPEKQKQR